MAGPRVAVATSGGLDSTALLHCTLAQARPLGLDVVALHVHHGLMPQADDWLAQVRRQALRWGAAFESARLQGQPGRGESTEAWAREGRYAALACMAQAQGCSLVLLAHHRRDQAETWLLQALRGAGEAGLSAMPRQALREGLQWCRPWLDMDRAAVLAYARRHRLRWVEDSSNADPAYARSRLRVGVWPTLEQAFPQAEATLALAARHAQSAQALSREVALDDLADVSSAEGLHLPHWLDLGPARRRNVLRWWLRDPLGAFPPHTLVERLLDELPGARSGRWPAPTGELRLHRGRLVLSPNLPPVTAVPPPQVLDLSQAGTFRLPAWAGQLRTAHVAQGGAPVALLRRAVVHARQGGEQFQLAPQSAARSLKKQYQGLEIPAWARTGPLVSAADGPLLFVPHLGMDARAWAPKGEPQLALHWLPDPASETGPSQPPG